MLSYQYSRASKLCNDGLHRKPFIIKSSDWAGKSKVKTVPIGQKEYEIISENHFTDKKCTSVKCLLYENDVPLLEINPREHA